MTKKYFKIEGIDHDRYVGIAKNDGKAYDFYILNIGGYRPAETSEEVADCEKVGKEYYNVCRQLGAFSLSSLSEEDMKNELYEYTIKGFEDD